eukprot:7470111-Lingulodinium_polyedra.AAC.1
MVGPYLPTMRKSAFRDALRAAVFRDLLPTRQVRPIWVNDVSQGEALPLAFRRHLRLPRPE